MAHPLKFYLKRTVQWLAGVFLFVVITITVTFFIVTAPPATIVGNDHIVNDVTQLNPIRMNQIKKPKSVEEIVALVKESRGPVSIGGARHSMGGQIGTENALHLDMRDFNEIVSYD